MYSVPMSPLMMMQNAKQEAETSEDRADALAGAPTRKRGRQGEGEETASAEIAAAPNAAAKATATAAARAVAKTTAAANASPNDAHQTAGTGRGGKKGASKAKKQEAELARLKKKLKY